MGVCDNFFDDRITAIRISVCVAVTQRVAGKALTLRLKVSLFFLKESLSVGDEILKITNLRVIYRRIIDLGDDAVPKRELDPAGSGVGCANPVFTAMRPFGLDARPPEGRPGYF